MPFTCTSTVMRVSTLRALMSSPPITRLLSISAGGSGGMVERTGRSGARLADLRGGGGVRGIAGDRGKCERQGEN